MSYENPEQSSISPEKLNFIRKELVNDENEEIGIEANGLADAIYKYFYEGRFDDFARFIADNDDINVDNDERISPGKKVLTGWRAVEKVFNFLNLEIPPELYERYLQAMSEKEKRREEWRNRP